jgi:CRISPR-associated protein Csd1
MTDFLNQDSTSQPYQCGRLLAVLAALQREALGDVGTGVVQRYYVALSQSPSLVLGRLIGNAKNHLGKLDPGLGYRFEERIAEIAARLNADTLPSTLMPHDQSLFALGYYHQLAYQRAEAARRSAEKKARAAGSNAETSAGDSRTPR